MFIQKYRTPLILGILCSALFTVPATSETVSPNDILVIASKYTSADSISESELQQIFLKQKTSWSNGERIVAINAPKTDPSRKIFREKILKMTEMQEDTYWEDQKIRAQIDPPVEINNTPKIVFKLKSVVSYAFRKDVPSSLFKVLTVIPDK